MISNYNLISVQYCFYSLGSLCFTLCSSW